MNTIPLSVEEVFADCSADGLRKGGMLLKKRLLSLVIAGSLLLGSVPVFGETDQADPRAEKIFELNGPDADVTWSGGSLIYLNGTLTEAPVPDGETALSIVRENTDLLGIDEDAFLLPGGTYQTPNGTTVYTFREYADGWYVLGSTVKIAVDQENRMTGLFSSLIGAASDEDTVLISAEEAEAIVQEKTASDTSLITADAPSEMVVLPYEEKVDVYAEEVLPDKLAWAVYTTQPEGEFPYKVHYVSLTGEYLYSMDVRSPGDAASKTGYDPFSVFEAMEAGEASQTLTHADGETEEVTFPVMKDRTTGRICLGDLERRIAVADFWSLFFDDSLELTEAGESGEWDDHTLGAYLGYIKAYDYYQTLGYDGPDDLKTPILLVKDFCEEDHRPVDNAAYIGKLYGWQTFATSSLNALWDCMDVILHEYMHGITGSNMSDQVYENDIGAINEGMSDILGELGENRLQGTDITWEVGEDSETTVRNMADPNSTDQPAYVWDSFYAPHSAFPGLATDQGGVHTNSSLLNLLASRLVEEAGMTPDQAVTYWLTVDCFLTPGTGYPEITDQLRFALTDCNMPEYREALDRYIQELRLEETELCEELEPDQVLVELELPETEAFEDPNWVLMVISIDSGTFLDGLLDLSEEEDGKEESKDSGIHTHLSWPEPDNTHKIRLVQEKSDTVFYIFINMSLKERSFQDMDVHGGCIYKEGRWVKLSEDMLENLLVGSDVTKIRPRHIISLFWNMIGSSQDVSGTDHYILNTDGLEEIKLDDDQNAFWGLFSGGEDKK